LDSSANNYILTTTSVTVINAIGNGIGSMALGARAGNTSAGSATIFTNRTIPDSAASIIITEGFASAFRTATQSSNSGVAVPNGTQIRLTFNGVPTGVTLALTVSAGDSTTTRGVSLSNSTITSTATTTIVSFTGSGTGTGGAPSLTATDTVEIDAAISANTTAAVTTPGVVSVTATLSPIGVATNNDTATALGLPTTVGGYPTFVQLDVGPVTLVNIVAASTTMLIPLGKNRSV